jgi:Concanavalin A-like lectin/glucanases superfamily
MKKYTMILSLILAVVMVSSCENYMDDLALQANLNEGLVAYWPIIGNSGLSSITDYSGNNNNATSFVSSMNFDVGKYNTALKNNGSGFTSLKNGVFNKSDGFTYSAWYKNLGFSSGSNCGMFRMHASGTITFYIMCNPFSGYFYIQAAGSTTLSVVSSDLTTWRYVTVTYDGDYLKLFLDGVCVSEIKRTSANKSINTSNAIEVLHEGGSYCLGGFLDEIRVYNRALSQDEIKALMDIGID